ncbi:hypothetical protein [Nocardia sp. NPDC019302]|uniref:hypothetical protein n=1 Tax=Nocardia sp. NPDC019302 TaxID=3154592 RepID=UPI00340C5857
MPTDDEPLGFLQSMDGTWSVVGPDGWPVEIRSYGDLETTPATQKLGVPTIDVAPHSVTDTEVQRELDAAQ